jgi:surface carbohydrate biosynthesis protein (TIGR04326 family)
MRSKKIFWNNLNDNQSSGIDLSVYIEKNKEKIKKKYLSIIELISNTNLNGSNILQISQILRNFNLYENSLIEEKSIYKSKNIIFLLKIIALEFILKKGKFQQYEIFCVEKENIKVLKNIFFKKKKNVFFHYTIYNQKVRKIIWFYNYLPNIIKVIYQVVKNFFFITSLSKVNIKFHKIDYLFFSNTYYLKYFFKNNVRYENRLIGDVANIVKKKDKAIIICHCDKSYASEKETQKILLNSNKNFQLISLNSLLNIKILIKSFLIYIFYFFFNFKLRKFRKKIKNNVNLNNYFDLIKADWDSSFYGVVAFENIKNYLILKNFFCKIQVIKKCYYICENQGWEKIFVKLCKTFFNKYLVVIGIINTAIRFWDLRYFFTISKKNISPDKVIINQNIKFNQKTFHRNFCTNIIKRDNIFKNYVKNFKKSNTILNRVLIFGDIIKYHNEMLLNFLNNNFNQINFDFKPHPSTPINLNNYLKLRIRNINFIKNKYNKIISIGTTSALIEAISLSRNVAVFIPPGSLNFSPDINKKIKILYNEKDVKNFIL